MQVRRLIQGQSPVLVSIPHAGTFVPPDIKARLTSAARHLPDTDFHVDRLYDFAAGMGMSLLTATHSRYVIDLNRADTDTDLYPGKIKTGLCPLYSFDGQTLYKEDEEPDHIECANRITAYWLPYHETLAAELERIKSVHGYAVLYDAHSIKSQVPRLFDGILPDLNLGTAHGTTCDAKLQAAVERVMFESGYHAVSNGRFVGGHITRHYGRPQEGIHALQMEIAQKNYMNEETFLYDEAKADKLRTVLSKILKVLESVPVAA